MSKELSIPIFDLILCLSQAVDYVSPLLNDHHKRVAYISLKLGEELGLPLPKRKELAIAGALHDVGALSLKERIGLLEFEEERPYEHAHVGYSFLKTFQPFTEIADLVQFHHVPWDHGAGSEFEGKSVSTGNHILHLADRVAVLIDAKDQILKQVPAIMEIVDRASGRLFMPKLMDSFKSLASKEYFWFDLVSPTVEWTSIKDMEWESVELNGENLLELTNLFRRIIDFRSPFTATHSSGVAATAQAMSDLAGFSEDEIKMMLIAGYLHDLGKLAVPKEILEKPGELSREEFDVMRHHAYYTDRILRPISVLDIIRNWGALHHERLDGSGYPFHLSGKNLPLGSKIMAVADVFVALTEDRPYRKGMNQKEALGVVEEMADSSALDSELVSLLRRNFNELNSVRIAAQEKEINEYNKLLTHNGTRE
jgi:HD-GYP domain-containing protein (c-di-GMP phosphodiesterase class II)